MQPATAEQLFAFFTSPSGRATRQEFLLGMGFLIVLNMAVLQIVLPDMDPAGITMDTLTSAILWSLPFIPSQILISIRRCHDINLTGFVVLISMLFTVWIVLLLFLAVIPGNKDANRYGPPVDYQ